MKGKSGTAARIVNAVRKKVGGTIFHIVFIKRTNGEVRHMNCRLGVSKGVTGKGMAYDPIEKGLLTVYDTDKRGYRTVPVDGVVCAKIKKVLYLGPMAEMYVKEGHGQLW
jgi:hypothetical protein